MLIDAELPPTAMVREPVPTTVVPLETGCEARLAAVARFCTWSEYVAGMAPPVADPEATLLSLTVAVRPASVLGVSKVVSVACRVERALLNVP
jgi:hypothetical protein